MKYIKDFKESDRVFDIYLCKHKQSAVTKNGKPYENVILQDKTGIVDAKIWDPNNAGIEDFDSLDYIEVYGDVTSFQGAFQVNVKRVRKCRDGEYDPADYLPVSKFPIDEMMKELLALIGSIENPYLKKLLRSFFVEDEEFVKVFRQSSAAKTVHHGFVGGLLQHTLAVARLCDYFCTQYPVLKRDLLLTAAICHDIGKTKELSLFPQSTPFIQTVISDFQSSRKPGASEQISIVRQILFTSSLLKRPFANLYSTNPAEDQRSPALILSGR